MRTASIYIHFPYCLAKCPYCDFVSYAQPRDEIDHAGYADAVLRELEGRESALDGREIGSIFFGGGTPSLWDPVELGRGQHFLVRHDLAHRFIAAANVGR